MLARPVELVVHSLEGRLVECGVLRPHNEGSESVEGENDGILLHLAVENGNFGAAVGELFCVDLEGQTTSCHVATVAKEHGKHV